MMVSNTHTHTHTSLREFSLKRQLWILKPVGQPTLAPLLQTTQWCHTPVPEYRLQLPDLIIGFQYSEVGQRQHVTVASILFLLLRGVQTRLATHRTAAIAHLEISPPLSGDSLITSPRVSLLVPFPDYHYCSRDETSVAHHVI